MLEKGQALLIVIMVLATVITVVLATTFTSRTDTQTTKLEEESQKALAAAEAGIEKILSSGQESGTLNIQDVSADLRAAGLTGTVTVAPSDDSDMFISPLIKQDEQYTYYAAPYTKSTNTFGSSTAQNLTICFGSTSSGTHPALEITLVKADYSINHFLVDPDARVSGAASSTAGCSATTGFAYSYVIPSASIGTNTNLMIVRALFTDTKFVVDGVSPLPTQGLNITSQARTGIGATKRVELFQSYPQIPSDFFVTQF